MYWLKPLPHQILKSPPPYGGGTALPSMFLTPVGNPEVHEPSLLQNNFNPFTPIPINTRGVSKSPQVRFFKVWLSLNCFPVHQPVATNSMHLQSSSTPHLQHLQSEVHLKSSWTSTVDLFCRNSQCVKVVGCFCRWAPSWMFDRILNATWPNN